jgi:hypothetical protein
VLRENDAENSKRIALAESRESSRRVPRENFVLRGTLHFERLNIVKNRRSGQNGATRQAPWPHGPARACAAPGTAPAGKHRVRSSSARRTHTKAPDATYSRQKTRHARNRRPGPDRGQDDRAVEGDGLAVPGLHAGEQHPPARAVRAGPYRHYIFVRSFSVPIGIPQTYEREWSEEQCGPTLVDHPVVLLRSPTAASRTPPGFATL